MPFPMPRSIRFPKPPRTPAPMPAPAMPRRRVAEEDLDEGVELAATSLIDCYEARPLVRVRVRVRANLVS